MINQVCAGPKYLASHFRYYPAGVIATSCEPLKQSLRRMGDMGRRRCRQQQRASALWGDMRGGFIGAPVGMGWNLGSNG